MKNKRFAVLKKRFKTIVSVRNLIITASMLLLLGSLSWGFYFYKQVKDLQNQALNDKDPAVIAEQESDALVAKIGKLIMLPEGETPTVATVTDPQKLKDQPFFTNAKRGDKVLLYIDAKKAYLYDPVANILIDVGPLNLTPSTSKSSLPNTATSTK